MPRRSNRSIRADQQGSARPSASAPPVERTERYLGRDYIVRLVAGSRSAGPYRCPGCDQVLAASSGHVVAWPVFDVDDRRHWHTACWQARDARRPVEQRSRNAPRYG